MLDLVAKLPTGTRTSHTKTPGFEFRFQLPANVQSGRQQVMVQLLPHGKPRSSSRDLSTSLALSLKEINTNFKKPNNQLLGFLEGLHGLYNCFGQHCRNYSKSSNPGTHDVFLFVCVLTSFSNAL